MKTIIIAAVARNGVIGCSQTNNIPWSYPEDLAFFKRETMGHAVVMGRRTWESIPERFRPLKGRANIVISRHMFDGEPGVYIARSIDEAVRMTCAYEETDNTKIYIIGGAQLYAAALPIADELVLTLIDRDYEGDVLFPEWDDVDGMDCSGFECVERRAGETPGLIFTRWRKAR